MRRPLEELVDAAGRLASGDRKRPGRGRRPLGDGDPRRRLQRDGRGAASREEVRREELDRLKDEFVLTASHELRSPLTSVQGFAELLMLERESLTPRQAETVEVILDNCRHLVRLLNDLLDLARSDAGRLAHHVRSRPSVAPLLDDVVRTMRRQTESRRPVHHRADPARSAADQRRASTESDQILMNLITNAHEYSPEGASIGVAASARLTPR